MKDRKLKSCKEGAPKLNTKVIWQRQVWVAKI